MDIQQAKDAHNEWCAEVAKAIDLVIYKRNILYKDIASELDLNPATVSQNLKGKSHNIKVLLAVAWHLGLDVPGVFISPLVSVHTRVQRAAIQQDDEAHERAHEAL